MGRLDVYPMPGREGSGYVVDVQATILNDLESRVVIPLIPLAGLRTPIKDLNPVFEIAGEPHVMLTQAVGIVPARHLKTPRLSLDAHHDAITRALDILLIGY
jgi:toxin CcdB